jgi:hypothetical protein
MFTGMYHRIPSCSLTNQATIGIGKAQLRELQCELLNYCVLQSKIYSLICLLLSDPYVKVWLQFGDKRIEKRKTPIFKCTLNPVFNETFSFNVPWEKIRECSLDVMVMDFDNIGRNELIGRILLAGKLMTTAV